METPFEALIDITRKHIDDGIPSCPTNCVVANALWDHFGGIANISSIDIGFYRWRVYMCNGDMYEGETSEDAKFVISNFDDHLEVNPCSIKLSGMKRSRD